MTGERDGQTRPKWATALKEHIEGLPGIAIASLGVACAVFLKEAQKIPAFHDVEMGNTLSVTAALASLVALAVLALAYATRPTFRLSRRPAAGVAIGVALLAATLLMYASPAVAGTPFAFICKIVARTCELLMMVAWAETLIRFRACDAALVVSFALGIVGGLDLFTVLLDQSMVVLLVAASAPMSACLMYWFRSYNSLMSPVVQTGARDGQPSSVFAIDTFLRQNIVDEATRDRASFIVPFLSLFLLMPLPMGAVQHAWLPLQSDVAARTAIQVAYALGAFIAAVLLACLTLRFWGRRRVLLYSALLMPVVLIALYLTGMEGLGFAFAYALLQNIMDKTMVFFLFMAPFLMRFWAGPMSVFTCALALFETGKLIISQTISLLGPSQLALANLAAVLAITAADAALVVGDNQTKRDCQNGGIHTCSMSHDETAPTDHRGAPGDNAAGGAQTPTATIGVGRDLNPCSCAAATFRLTPREEEVLALLAEGLTASEVAEQLIIGLATAKSHMRSIYAKMGVHTQSDLILTLRKFEQQRGGDERQR